MITGYDNRALRQNDRANIEPVRVRRPWRGVTRGQVLNNLPQSKRRKLLRGGFIELVNVEIVVKKKTKKKKA